MGPTNGTNGCGGRGSNGTNGSTCPSAADTDQLEPIAIVGYSMRFPQEATTDEGFWEILRQGRSVMTEVPPDRFNVNGFYHPDPSHPGTINSRGAHFLQDDIAAFDAPFFSMNPTEVESMDPQQRILLETSYHALENAGVPIEKAAGSKTSVYVGCLGVEYNQFFDGDDEIQPMYKATGTGSAILSNRLSWFYDFKGPSMTIETACSSSMVGLHLACQSLRARESKMSLVCGSQLYLEPLTNAISLSRLQFMSSDSRCLSFDAKGNGYAKGEGFGVLVLKPLSEAIAAGDSIRAVIRSTATNQDGRTPGMTQPSQTAQEAQIREAYRTGGLDLRTTRLFEAHGTGTAVGDPIEAEAIRAVFQEHRSRDDPMYVSAVKSNIGHLEATAGIAGVIKVILCIEKGIIPPNAGFETLNPRIHADDWNLRFPSRPVPWPTPGLRRASINSFGYGGSNAHVVLDDAYNYLRQRKLSGCHFTVKVPPATASDAENDALHEHPQDDNCVNGPNGVAKTPHKTRTSSDLDHNPADNPCLLVWSASEAAAIQRLSSVYKEHISRISPGTNARDYLRNLAYTLSNRRSILPWKSYLVANSLDDLETKLEEMPQPIRSSVPPKLCFVFTGQGAQWATMGLQLLTFPVFRESLTCAESVFKSLGSTWSLIEEMEKPSGSSSLDNPVLAQPICTALQVALVELLAYWGVRPWGITGHSSGEIAAAFCAGAISRQSAWTIAYFRGVLAAQLATLDAKERGAMMAVQLSQTDLQHYLKKLARIGQEGTVSVGCENSPGNYTLTGRETAIDYLKSQLDDDGIFCRKLNIPVAYHSTYMEAISEEYLGLLQSIDKPELPVLGKDKPHFVSSVTGDCISLERLSRPEYWVQNLVSRVRFAEAAEKLSSITSDALSGNQTVHYVEVGPHSVLHRPIKDSLSHSEGLLYQSTLRRGTSSLEALKNLAGKLFAEGYRVDLERVNGHIPADTPPRMLIDLPKYPFNHSQRYWLESRLFRNYRQRNRLRHELLGLPSTDWNVLKPRWRHTLRIADLPWLKDHQVNGSVVYPAAGMLAMVIEAAKSIAIPGSVVRGYRLREVTIFNALVIPSEKEGLEVQLYMQNQRNNATTSMPSIESRDFCLSSCSDNEWRDVCSGTIITEYAEKSSGTYDAQEDNQRFGDDIRSRFTDILENCSEKTTHERFYTMGREMGYDFGPTFQTLHDISYDPAGNFASGTIILDEWMEKTGTEAGQVQDHVIHPTSLDGVLQTVAVLTNRGGSILGSLQAPSQFRDFWVSNDLLSRGPDASIRVAAKTHRVAIRDTDASIVALHSGTSNPAIVLDGYRATTVSSHHYMPSERRNIFYALEWKPDVDLLSQSEKERHCLQEDVTRLVWDPSKRAVCLYYISKALHELDEEGFRSDQFHLQKYMDWMRLHLNELGDQNLLLDAKWQETLAPENREQYLAQFVTEGPAERAIYTFCSQLTKIIKGEVDPLDLLFNRGLANDIYADEVFKVMGERVAAFVDLVSHKNPNMDILEIGAGTGSITHSILSLISQQDRRATPKYNSYTFTDISPSFFEKARDRFAYHTDRMNFKTLDIERSPADQGFELGTYDLVVAAMVLHATATIKETLQHAKSLLKPGGCLVLVEPTNKRSTVSDGVWGTLPGWWRGTEKDREWSPLYSREEWELRLEETGFGPVELALTDHSELDHHTLSFFVSKAPLTEAKDVMPFPSMIVSAGTKLQQETATNVAAFLKSAGASSCDIVDPRSLLSCDDKYNVCVSLLDLEHPFLSSMSEDGLTALKKIVTSSDQVYWITSGSGANARQPEKAMASGFSRAMWEEQLGLRFASIDVDDPKTAVETFQRIFERSSQFHDPEDWETDYRQSGGVISVPRVMEACNINDFVHSQTGRPEIENREVGKEPTEPLKLEFSFGQLDSFRFARDETIRGPLEEDEVEVQVKATGINFMDMMVILGQMAGSYIGAEYSGVVTKVGSAVKSLSPGDRVCSMVPSTFKTFVRSKAYSVARIPDSLLFTEAFPAVYLTAIYGLNHLGRLRKGDSILIHAAAGAVGQVAIQLAQHIGADVFVTVSSTEKRSLIQEAYGIPDNRIFFSRNVSFGRQIMQTTNGRGVDVVLNSLSGEGLAESWRSLAPLGRFVEIGKRDIHTFQNLPMHPFSKNVSYYSVDLETVDRHDPAFMGQMVKEMENILSANILSAPQPVSVFSRGEFESAIRYLQTGRHMGKAVIDWEEEAEIPVVPSPDAQYYFDPNASYVIAGGLGGIGRSLASWFASRGAKHLILLSRSGPKSEVAMKFVEDLASRGVNVATPQCDVISAKSLQGALGKIAERMPPIKGCIQGSMVLRDRMLENMTREEWQGVVDPKIQGTWNLHDILPCNMDFFVILSSVGGLAGSGGQSQYNASSTFQDAFARHRWSLGEKCITIDVGVVTGVGYVAERSNVAKRWGEKGLQVIHEQELLSIVDWACNPDREVSSPWSTQVITAVGPSKKMEKEDLSKLQHMRRPLFRHLHQMGGQAASTTQTKQEKVDYEALLRGAGSLPEAGSIVADALAGILSRALSVPIEDIDTTKPAHSYGVDSLVAVELRFWFTNEVKADISVFNILSNDSISALGQLAASKSEYVSNE